MPRRTEFYFDFASPYSYLTGIQPVKTAALAGAAVAGTPFRVAERMTLAGDRPTTIDCKNKGTGATADLGRWAGRYRVALQRHPTGWSFEDALRGRGAIAPGRAADGVNAVFAAVWAETVNPDERPVLIDLLDKADVDGARLAETAARADDVAGLEPCTAAAAERGAFGSPTFSIGDQRFFGNDRLWFGADALAAAA
jgi:2-hydroxychromene-2-carboxylate isomerase